MTEPKKVCKPAPGEPCHCSGVAVCSCVAVYPPNVCSHCGAGLASGKEQKITPEALVLSRFLADGVAKGKTP